MNTFFLLPIESIGTPCTHYYNLKETNMETTLNLIGTIATYTPILGGTADPTNQARNFMGPILLLVISIFALKLAPVCG